MAPEADRASPTARRTPVAVFFYNRPEHARRVLDSLAACARRDDCEFHFFADGAKTPAHAEAVGQTRALLRRRAPEFDARLVEREHNLGLARSIAGAVGELCRTHGRVIVVEDDLVLDPDFLHFMLAALDRYADDAEVLQVGGCTLSPPAELATDGFLLPVTTTWGWGTWQRAWEHFEWSPQVQDDLRTDPDWLDRFNLGGVDFMRMLDDRLAARNDSWGVLWWYAVARRHGLVAYPARSLVWNGGFDGSGVHCGTGDPFPDAAGPAAGTPLPARPAFPAAVRCEPRHLEGLREYFRTTYGGAGAARAQPGLRAAVGRAWRTMTHAFR